MCTFWKIISGNIKTRHPVATSAPASTIAVVDTPMSPIPAAIAGTPGAAPTPVADAAAPKPVKAPPAMGAVSTDNDLSDTPDRFPNPVSHAQMGEKRQTYPTIHLLFRLQTHQGAAPPNPPITKPRINCPEFDSIRCLAAWSNRPG